MTADLRKLLDGVHTGNPTKHQIDSDKRDPVSDETADDAEESLKETGLVNPFHAVELQRRLDERRREQSESLMDTLEKWDND